jgi:protein translocase SecG subunit
MLSILLLSTLLFSRLIIAQSTKGGLVGGFSNGYQVAGVKRSMHFLNPATWVLGGAFILLCLVGR